jgi:hypothetical protein
MMAKKTRAAARKPAAKAPAKKATPKLKSGGRNKPLNSPAEVTKAAQRRVATQGIAGAFRGGVESISPADGVVRGPGDRNR